MALNPAIQKRLDELRAAKDAENAKAQTEAPATKQTVDVDVLAPVEEVSPQLKAANFSSITPTTLSAADQIIGRIEELKVALQEQAPGYERLLQVIHTAIAKDEALCFSLTEDQVNIICAGLAKKTNVVIQEKAVRSKKESIKLSAMTADDF